MTTFSDIAAKTSAQRAYMSGAMHGKTEVVLAELHDAFKRYWRLAHCTTCGKEITDSDIGNVTVTVSRLDPVPVTACHKVCSEVQSETAL